MTNNKIAKLIQDPLILPIYVPSFLSAVSQGILMPVLPLFAASFNVPYYLIGLVVGGQALGMLFGDLPAGMIQRQFGLRDSYTLGILIIMVSMALLFWAPSIALVLMLRFLDGFGQSMIAVARHSYIAEATASNQRGRSVALFGGIFRIGFFVGPIIGGSLAAVTTLRMPFLVCLGFLGAAGILFFIFAPPSTVTNSDRISPLKYAQSLIHTAHRNQKNLLTSGIGQTLFQILRFSPRQIIIPLYAADALGLDVGSIGVILSLSSMVDMSLFYPAGMIMDRLGRKVAILISMSGLILGTAIIPITSGYTDLLLTALLIGLSNGMGSGTMMTLGADLAPPEAHAEFFSLWRIIGDIGQTSAPLIVGWIADIFLLSATPVVIAGFGLIGVMVFAFSVPETLNNQSLKPD